MSSVRKKRKAFVDQSACVACGCCVKVCPLGAVQIVKGIMVLHGFGIFQYHVRMARPAYFAKDSSKKPSGCPLPCIFILPAPSLTIVLRRSYSSQSISFPRSVMI